MPNHIPNLFTNAFDTFKAFDNLCLADLSTTPANAPKTIWQILNHLIKWQGYQLGQLKNAAHAVLNEDETWIAVQQPANQDELDDAVSIFNSQQRLLQDELATLSDTAADINHKLKIVQDLSVHLSFHLGEIVLLRRMAGTYPLPHQMKDFLS